MSIATRIENMTNNLENAYNNIENLGIVLTNTNKNLENLSTVLEEVYENYPKVSGAGTDITLNNTAKGKMPIEVSGNTEQTTYTGETESPSPDYPQDVRVVTGENTVKVVNKNLFDKNYYLEHKNDFFISYEGYFYAIELDDSFKKQITASISLKGTVLTNYAIAITDNIGTSPNNNVRILTTDGTIKNITYDFRNAKHVYLQVGSTTKNTAIEPGLNLIFNNYDIQIEENLTATTYEEHQEQSLSLSLQSRNLFDKNTVTVETRLNGQGVYYHDSSYSLSDYIPCKPNTSYTGSTIFVNAYNRIGFYDKNKTLLSLNDGGNVSTITTPNNSSVAYMRFTKETTQLDTYMLVEGSTVPTSYQPYYHYELCKIGDYKDYPWKDESTGKWYVKKKISKVILDGSENWEGGQTGTVSTDYTYVYTSAIDNLVKILYYGTFCDRFKNLNKDMSISTNVTTDTISVGSSASRKIRIMIKTSRLSAQSISAFKTWLSTNNTVVYYVLATPIDIEITDITLINQLEAIYNTAKSYKTQTHIFTITEDNNVAPILDVTALLD